MIGAVAAALAWQLWTRHVANPGLFPPLQAILAALVRWQRSGLLLSDCLESLPRAYLTLLIATPLGVALGLALALQRTLDAMLDGSIQLLRSLPPVALLPLFILWFGIDWDAKLKAAVFVCVFPVAITTSQAAIAVDRRFRELAVDLDMSLAAYCSRVVVPGALPGIVPGVRLAAGTSFIMLFVSELAGASRGIGYRISLAQLAYQADLMLAALLVLGLAGLVTDLAIMAASGRMLHYARD